MDAVVLIKNFQIQSPVDVQMGGPLMNVKQLEDRLEGGVVQANCLYFEEEDS